MILDWLCFSSNKWWQQEHASHDVFGGFTMDAGMINALLYNKNWCIISILSVQIFIYSIACVYFRVNIKKKKQPSISSYAKRLMSVSFLVSTICSHIMNMISNKEQLLAEAIDYTHVHPAAFIVACFLMFL